VKFYEGQWITFQDEDQTHEGFILGFINDHMVKVAVPIMRQVHEVYKSKIRDNETIKLKRDDFESIEDLAIASRDSDWFNQAKKLKLSN
jgi:hypothetical protein